MHLGARAVRMLEKLRRIHLLHDRSAMRRAQSCASSAREAKPLEKLEERLLLMGLVVVAADAPDPSLVTAQPGEIVRLEVHFDNDGDPGNLFQPHPAGLLSAGAVVNFGAAAKADVVNGAAIQLVPELDDDGAGGPPMKVIEPDRAGFTAGIPLFEPPYQGTLIATIDIEILPRMSDFFEVTPELFFNDGRVNFLAGEENNPIELDASITSFTGVFVLVEPVLNAPVADAGSAQVVNEGGTIMLSAADSMDDMTAPTALTYSWDLDGDGFFGETGNAASAGDEVGVNPTFEANFDGPLTHPVFVRVGDSDGNVNKASTTIQINNLPPAAMGASFDKGGMAGRMYVPLPLIQWIHDTVRSMEGNLGGGNVF